MILHIVITFLPTPASVAAWVNIWTFSLPLPPLPPLSHLQICVSIRYITFMLGTENAMGGHGSLAVYAILCPKMVREVSLKKKHILMD